MKIVVCKADSRSRPGAAVKRTAGGQFKESDDIRRSLSADRRRAAKTSVQGGHGDQGAVRPERQRGGSFGLVAAFSRRRRSHIARLKMLSSGCGLRTGVLLAKRRAIRIGCHPRARVAAGALTSGAT
jgi:hypothetical protein